MSRPAPAANSVHPVDTVQRLHTVTPTERTTRSPSKALACISIKSNRPQVLEPHTRPCSIHVNARDLTAMGPMVTVGGKDPGAGPCGSGKWLCHTGLPAKSGVGGGLIAVSPDKFGIAAVYPPLDGAGDSVSRAAGNRRCF